MSQFETRNLAHRWVFGTLTSCSVCHCLDMVAVCAEYHEAGCKCTNPPCPPTEQERAEMAAVLSKVINKQSDAIAKGGVITKTVLGIVGDGFNTCWPTPTPGKLGGFPVWEINGDITMLEQDVDLLNHVHVFKCNCKQHGTYTVKVSMEATSASAYEDIRVYIARLLAESCQGCTILRRAQNARAALKGTKVTTT